MTRRKTRKEKKRLLLIFFIMSLLLIYFGVTIYGDFCKIKDNRNTKETLTNQYENLLDNKKSLESELTKMQDPEYVARYAKEKYMYSSTNEVILQLDN